jgi:hypothetical protein
MPLGNWPTGVLNPTPIERLVDRSGRPYFLWDNDITLEEFHRVLREGDDVSRGYMIAKMMRQAKPDDVFLFVTPQQIASLWPRVNPHLGAARAMWTWLFDLWEGMGRVHRAA